MKKLVLSLFSMGALSVGVAHADVQLEGKIVKFDCRAEVVSGKDKKGNDVGSQCVLIHVKSGEVFSRVSYGPDDTCSCNAKLKFGDLSAKGASMVKERTEDGDAEFNKAFAEAMREQEQKSKDQKKFYDDMEKQAKSKGLSHGTYLGNTEDGCQAYNLGRAQVLRAVTCLLKVGATNKVILTRSNKDCLKSCQTFKGTSNETLSVQGYKYSEGRNESGQACESYRVDYVEGARKVLCRVVLDGEESLNLLGNNQECRSQCKSDNDSSKGKAPASSEGATGAPKKKGGSKDE